MVGIIISVIAILLGLVLVGFAIWFCDRTPSNLKGYYSGPVNFIVAIVVIVFIIIGIGALFML